MDPEGAVLPQNCKHWLHLWSCLKPECKTSVLESSLPIIFPLHRSNEARCVFSLAPTCKLDTLLTVLTSLQTQHRSLKAWMCHNSTLRANNKTSIFKMSPLRLNSSIFTASSCLHRLSVSTWLNSITLHTMEIQGRLTPLTFVWRPAWCLESFYNGWRTYVNQCHWWRPLPGNKCWHYSSACIFLSITFSECFHRDWGGQRWVKEGECVGTAYLSESASGQEK